MQDPERSPYPWLQEVHMFVLAASQVRQVDRQLAIPF